MSTLREDQETAINRGTKGTSAGTSYQPQADAPGGHHPQAHSDAVNAEAVRHVRSPRSRASLYWFFFLAAFAAVDVFFGLAAKKAFQVKAGMEMGAKMAPPPPAVTSSVVHEDNWQPTLAGIGSMEAVQGVTVSADLPGVIKEIRFESGTTVKQGEILVALVTDQEQAQLEASEAMRDLSVYSLRRQRDLLDKKASSQSDFDTAEAQQRQMEANVAAAKAAIARKTIRASFTGQLGIRLVNLGQYLNSGDKIVSLQALDPIHVNFNLPQQYRDAVKLGTNVELRTDATGDRVFQGKINAQDSLVDTATRNFQIQATLENKDGVLLPGMFAKVTVLLPGDQKVLPVPSSAINHAPYGDSVFVVHDGMKDPLLPAKPPFKGVTQQFVKTGPTRGDLVAILSGLKPGDEVITSGVFKLINGAPVNINNSVKPDANANPNPEDS